MSGYGQKFVLGGSVVVVVGVNGNIFQCSDAKAEPKCLCSLGPVIKLSDVLLVIKVRPPL